MPRLSEGKVLAFVCFALWLSTLKRPVASDGAKTANATFDLFTTCEQGAKSRWPFREALNRCLDRLLHELRNSNLGLL